MSRAFWSFDPDFSLLSSGGKGQSSFLINKKKKKKLLEITTHTLISRRSLHFLGTPCVLFRWPNTTFHNYVGRGTLRSSLLRGTCLLQTNGVALTDFFLVLSFSLSSLWKNTKVSFYLFFIFSLVLIFFYCYLFFLSFFINSFLQFSHSGFI
jgi:hypothetical protein